MSAANNQQKPRILICRLSHIGDCILTLPMLSAVRQSMPGAFIAWATEHPTPQLLEGHPDLDKLIRVPKGWLKSPRTILDVRSELRAHCFDIAIDPQSICKSAILAWVSGAKTRLGFGGEHGRELSPWFNNRRVDVASSHLVDRSLELLTGLEIETTDARFCLPLRDTASCYVDQFLDSQGLGESRYLAINPGASWPSKRWETDRFAKVARELHEMTGIPSIVTWAGDEENEMATEICSGAGETALLAPKTDLQQLAALLRNAELFIGCDTGPLHLAVAMDTTCIGLYGPTRPQDSGAYGQQHFAIQNQYQSGSCRQRRRAANRAMKTITATQVIDASCRALASIRVSASPKSQSAQSGKCKSGKSAA